MMSGRPSMNFSLQNPSTATSPPPTASTKDLPEVQRPPRRKSSGSKLWMVLAVFVLAGAGVVLGVPGVGKSLKRLFASSETEIIHFQVKPTHLPVTVVERGTLESSENQDVF